MAVPPPPDSMPGAEAGSPRDPIDAALAEVPRRAFYAHGDEALGVAVGRSMPSTRALRSLLAAMQLRPGARVLHIGTGSGYAAAVLSRVAAEVFTIERMDALVELARGRFSQLGYTNIHVRHGDGMEGIPQLAPFDAILVSTRGPYRLDALQKQLDVGGTLVATSGRNRRRQTMLRVTRRSAEQFDSEELGEISVSSDIGELLITLGMASPETIREARRRAVERRTALVTEVRELVRIDDAELYRVLALDRGLRFSNAQALLPEIDPRPFERIPRAFLDHNRMVPLLERDGVVRIATSNPDASIEDIQKAFHGRTIDLCLVTPTDLRRLWASLDLGLGSHDDDHANAHHAGVEDLLADDDGSLEAHAIALFDALLLDAIGERASDLHLERYGDQVVVRLRVDGELHDLPRYRLTPEELAGLINVIKVKANLDISERRLPQGGRARLRAGDDVFDLRIQTQPCLHGEHAVIRLLPQGSQLLGIDDLGFPAEICTRYRRLLSHPAGLVLVVGPTGSGKSTTLYGGLQVLAADKRRKVITVEDPIEYSIHGVQQTQVRPEIGFQFANAMRAFVREDPDVILVGEIRDSETALEAIRASQTGHLVLSTLHCNDAVDAVQRLFDLGMHPNSIASELLAVFAQRLAKRLCDRCRRPAEPDPEIMAELFPHGVPEGFRCFEGAGCDRCRGHGTRGRIAVIEFLSASPAVRASVARQPPLDELRATALGAGLISMRANAVRHVVQGTIPLSELPRILPLERLPAERPEDDLAWQRDVGVVPA